VIFAWGLRRERWRAQRFSPQEVIAHGIRTLPASSVITSEVGPPTIAEGLSVGGGTLRFGSNEDPGGVEVDGHRGRS
jgi:hypothetical protein